jgi:hypothetical protein
MLPAACVISMHYFVPTYCWLGYDTKVLLPARSLPEPVTACFDNSEENKLSPVINSVIRIFFPSRHTPPTVQGKIRYMVRIE